MFGQNSAYLERIKNSKSLVTITQISKDYGMSGQGMNELLHQLGVQYRQNGQWLLYSRYQGEGYTQSNTLLIAHQAGDEAKMHTLWTQKGRLFLYGLLKKNGILPLLERS